MRDLTRAARALAELRKELGEGSVVTAELRDAHLPEASFRWVAMRRVRRPKPRRMAERRLVRRIWARPRPLCKDRRDVDEHYLLRRVDPRSKIDELRGPFIIDGGWWGGPGVHREYFYARCGATDAWWWIFRCRRRRRWFLQGRVE